MAGLIKVGMTACCPLYTIPSARDSSNLKLKKGHTKGSTPVLVVGQPVIMRSDSFCRAGSPIPPSKIICVLLKDMKWKSVVEELLTGCLL